MKQTKIRLDYLIPEKNNFLLIGIDIGNRCNYSCSYCPEILHDGSLGFLNFDNLKNFLWQVKVHYQGMDICLRVSGGEPTLYRDFISLSKIANDYGMAMSLVTNGSRTLRWWNDAKDYIDGMFLSFHPENSDIEHLTNVVDMFDGNIPIILQVLMLPEKFDISMKAIDRFLELQSKNILVSPKVILKNFGWEPVEYTEEQKHFINNFVAAPIDSDKIHRRGMEFIYDDGSRELMRERKCLLEKQNNFKSWKCFAGLHSLIVDFTGDIYRGECHVGGSIGNISDQKIKFPEKEIICTKNFCSCLTDLYIKKIRD